MIGNRVIVFLIFALCLFLVGCGDDSVSPGAKIDGVWGADHHELVANSDGALLEYDCAHGSIDSGLVLDSNGRFELEGTHTREGGPIDLNNPPDEHPARYQGRLLGDRLVLTVTITDTGDVLGPFTLIRGERGNLYKCL
jgi:hypothetical protein